MSAHTPRKATQIRVPDMLSYPGGWDNEPVRRSWVSRVGAALLAVFGPRPPGARAELYAMTDRELADIGISRQEIERVCDPAFASEHASRRA